MTKFLILDANIPDKTKVVLNIDNVDIEQRKEGGFLILSGSGKQYSATTNDEVSQVHQILGKDVIKALGLEWIEKEKDNG